jgi:beta-glucosidase
MLPCELGGQAIAEIIYGRVNPSGRIPITYPKDTGNVMIPYRHRVTTQCASGDYCEPQWSFSHGLSYTNFTYSDMTVSTTNVTSSSHSVNVSVTATNSSSVAGKETVMLFLTQPYARSPCRRRRTSRSSPRAAWTPLRRRPSSSS